MNSFLYFLGVFAILTLAQRLSATSYSDEPEWSDIIGGETIEQENSLPMLVTININLTTKVELLGGGFILTKDWILTVGHLFYQFEEEYVKLPVSFTVLIYLNFVFIHLEILPMYSLAMAR